MVRFHRLAWLATAHSEFPGEGHRVRIPTIPRETEREVHRWLSLDGLTDCINRLRHHADRVLDEGLDMANLGYCWDRKRQHTLDDFKLDKKLKYHVCAFCGEKLKNHG